MNEALRLEGVCKSYGDVHAVHPLDLSVPAGAIYGLLGPNGAGKTTTIRMIMDIIKPDAGRIVMLGESDPEHRRDRIGYLPEERGIYRKMRVRELLVYFARLRRVDGRIAKQDADRWLERFGLAARAADKIETLSKGNAQKVQFIATVIHRPECVILDEPFSGFDPVNIDLVQEILLELRDQGMTIILSTHQMETVEKLCDAICLIHHGRKVLDGPLKQLKAERGSRAIQIEYEGTPRFLNDKSLVAEHSNTGQYVELLPVKGIGTARILDAASREVTIKRFQLMEPSLHRIFIETVKSQEA